MTLDRIDALVIGAGPAGLMAAEVLSRAGARVTLAEAKPSPARKFLMAGKSGLNLTKAEPDPAFRAAYGAAADWLVPMLSAFGPEAVQDWARGLGRSLFTGTTGRVFPVEMKASPLLRAWLARLHEGGVQLHTSWHWTGFDAEAVRFNTPDGPLSVTPRTTILALGGASWSRLGSDGAWAIPLAALGVPLAPFRPANAALRIAWSDRMAPHFGAPLKGIALTASPLHSRGEVVLTARGLEGGGLYPLSPALRDGATLTLDLAPDRSLADVEARLHARGKDSLSNHLRKALRLSPAQIALLHEAGHPLPDNAALASRIKALPLPAATLAPLDEAISTAGGIARAGLTEGLELHARPGTFACGEMLDWEAPTGGYLLTACLATGHWAGRAAARKLGL